MCVRTCGGNHRIIGDPHGLETPDVAELLSLWSISGGKDTPELKQLFVFDSVPE